ncbi:MAG: phosphoribosylamine--glycine ligase [Candidatus Bilamarchaeaceae archaeon]
MKVVLVGSGAREHAIAEQLSKSAELYTIMEKKHPGIAKLSTKFLIANPTDRKRIVEWCKAEGIELGFVSPDGLLAAGVSDILESAGVAIASPTKAAARIEWDKGYARNLMRENSIPGVPEFTIATSDAEVLSFIKDMGEIVVKPIGLTGGKGVRIMGEHFKSANEALNYASSLIKKDGSVLLEEKLDGEEITIQAFCDGAKIALMPPVQDHKRAFVGDKGPNTGGMGSYSTGALLPFMQQKDLAEADLILKKTVEAMAKEGNKFKGVLYGQFMITKKGLKLIEFNSRFGDPEAINVLMLLRTQLADILLSVANGNLIVPMFSTDCTVVKYLVPEGYPEKGKADEKIEVNEKEIWNCGAKFYFGSVYEKEDKIYTTTSRAIAIAAHGRALKDAEERVECGIRWVSGPLWHRSDIGTEELISKRVEHMKRLR